MQNSIELVKRALEFRGPERVPYNFDSNRTPEISTKYGDDLVWLFLDEHPDFVPSTPGERETGVVYETLDEKVMGLPKVHPLADISQLKNYRLPDYTDPIRYKTLEEEMKKYPDKYLLGMFPISLFQILIDLMGFENFMVAPMLYRDEFEHLLDMLLEQMIGVVNCMADRGIHGIIDIDDMGLQDRLMVSPRLWRELWKPRYAKLMDAAHKRNIHIFAHICGYIIDIIEDLIEIGLDAINLDQQDNMGLRELGRRFGGRICFFCPLDIQTTLSKSVGKEMIYRKTRQMIWEFGRFNGGFICKTYPQPEAIRIPEENNAWMAEAVKRFGVYPLKVEDFEEFR